MTSQRLIYMPEESTPTIAAAGKAVAYLETGKHTHYYGRLFAAAPKLLKACRTLAEDCRMALSGDWDKGDEGFEASLELLESAIAEATGGAVSPSVITIQVHRGLITDVSGLPRGMELQVEDYDVDDTEHPQWDAEKECIVSVYEGGPA